MDINISTVCSLLKGIKAQKGIITMKQTVEKTIQMGEAHFGGEGQVRLIRQAL